MILNGQRFTEILQGTLNPKPEQQDMKLRNNSIEILDYYYGKQKMYLDEYFNKHFKGWSDDSGGIAPRDLVALKVMNVTKKMINMLSMLYKKRATRTILKADGSLDEEATKIYNDITEYKNVKMRSVDAYTRMVKTTLVYTYWDNEEKKLRYRILTPNDCDVIEDGINPQKAVAVVYAIPQPTGDFTSDEVDIERFYIYWDSENVYYRTDTGNPVFLADENGQFNEDETNPYGLLPFAVFRDMDYNGSNFWQPIDEAFIDINESINVLLTDLNFAQQEQAFSQAVLKGVVRAPLTKSRLNVLVIPPDDSGGTTGDFSYVSPDSHIEEIISILKFWLNLAFYTNDLGYDNIEAKSSLRSGIAILASRLDLLEDRESRIELFRNSEKQLFNIERAVYNNYARAERLPVIPDDARIKIDFAEIDYPMSVDEEIKKLQFEIAENMTTPAKEILRRNPDLRTEEEAQSIVDSNKEINKANITLFASE